MYHWTDQKIKVHIFICLLGLTLSTVLQKELRIMGIDISKNKMMETLSLIRECWVKDTSSTRLVKVLEEMDESQVRIWSALSELFKS